ncbi:acyl-CoA dehydrogenase family protein [Pseudomonas marginalis]|uniref:acyl-CoA dehydrogenase family protein n=1 Tax=Pseudomonas marginalis TaxID=298 RepID=UPI00247FB0D9|nr:acyl-CoA dehydrogenase family protein [Pseudomonas marginalis]WGT27997.1 acyl-CoA dehydrogenase family protein [Pseudomonas marginalis]
MNALTHSKVCEVAMSTPLDSETKSIIDSTLLRFVDEFYDFTERRERLSTNTVDYRRHWPTLAELGVLGMPFTEEQGGLGGYALDIADAVSRMAKGLVLEPFVEAAVIAGSILAASIAAQARLDELIGGEVIDILLGGRLGSEDRLQVTLSGSTYRLNGTLRVQPYAAQADFWLIVANDTRSGEPIILRLAPDGVDVQMRSYRLLDGRPASDLHFAEVSVAASSLWLQGPAAKAALVRANRLAVSCLCADAVGVMAFLLFDTAEYLRTRKQFGMPLSSFQALQHRYADMQIAYLESRAITRKLALNLGTGSVAEQGWLSFAASSVVERAAALVGHEAIQMHGGMGVTDELVISHCNSRLVVLMHQLQNWCEADVELPE